MIFKFAQYSPNRLFQQFQILLKLLYHFQQVFFLLWFNFSVKLRFVSYLMNIEIIQKQPSRGVLKKRCFENMQQIYRSNFIEFKLRHRCSPVNLLRIFRTPFPKNTSGRLLLIIAEILFRFFEQFLKSQIIVIYTFKMYFSV